MACWLEKCWNIRFSWYGLISNGAPIGVAALLPSLPTLVQLCAIEG